MSEIEKHEQPPEPQKATRLDGQQRMSREQTFGAQDVVAPTTAKSVPDNTFTPQDYSSLFGAKADSVKVDGFPSNVSTPPESSQSARSLTPSNVDGTIGTQKPTSSGEPRIASSTPSSLSPSDLAPQTNPRRYESALPGGQQPTNDLNRGATRAQPVGIDSGYQPVARDASTIRAGDSGVTRAPEVQPPSTSTRTIGPIAITTTPDGKTTISKDVTQPSPQPAAADRAVASANPQGSFQAPYVAPEMQSRQSAPSGDVQGSFNQNRLASTDRVDNVAATVKPIAYPAGESSSFVKTSTPTADVPTQAKSASLVPELQSRTNQPAPSSDTGNRDLIGSNRTTSAYPPEAPARQPATGADKPIISTDHRSAERTPAFISGTQPADGQFKSNPAIADSQVRPNTQAPVDAQVKPLTSPTLDTQARSLAAPADVQGKSSSTPLDAQGRQSVAPADVQGRTNTAGNLGDSFGTRRETGIQMPDTKQTTGRSDTGVQLPDTKQSTGRTETGGAQAPDARNNTGRNDANTGKMPDAKTLANLDQKFGEKLNPPNKDTGLPIPMPGGGLPDILGGLRGDRDSKSVKDAKADPAGARDGAVRNEFQPGKEVKDAKSDQQGLKDSKPSDGRIDTKSGGDEKVAAGQKGTRSESDVAIKTPDSKAAVDVRATTQDGKSAVDGRTGEVRSQGGSNLVHDGGTKSDGTQSSRIDSAGKIGDRGSGIPDKNISDKVMPDKGVADKGGADKSGDAKTRLDQPGARVVDHDGKSIGGRIDGIGKTDGIGKIDAGDKGRSDTSSGARPPAVRGDGSIVLPPGSLPVPDLVAGVKNIGQQIDARIGKQPIDEKGSRQSDSGRSNGSKTDIGKGDGGKTDPVKADAGKGDIGKAEASKIDANKGVVGKGDAGRIDPHSMVGDGVKTVVTGGLRSGDKAQTQVDGKSIEGGKATEGGKIVAGGKPGEGVKPVDGAKPVDGVKPTDGVKTVVTGVKPADGGVKTVVTGGVADGVRTVVTGGVADGVKAAITGGAKDLGGVKTAGQSDGSVDGRQVPGKNQAAGKPDAAILIPPGVVPLTEMVGNLKGIAARIFPPESRTGRPEVFENSLPGRKTERLDDSLQIRPVGARPESSITIIRAIGERIGKTDEQFVIKASPLPADVAKAPQSRSETGAPLPPWIAPIEHADPDKLIGQKNVSSDSDAARTLSDSNAAKLSDNKSVKPDAHLGAKSSEKSHHDHLLHDEATEKMLADLDLELVGTIESTGATESDEEEIFPLAAVEYFGGDFEKAISSEEEVAFDGDGTVAEDDEQSTRYQYIVEAGDTVELIAIKVFKNVALAPLIYQINKDAIPIGMQDGRMVFTLKVGTIIWLPFPKEVKQFMGITTDPTG
jgi:hypothetical protein